MRSLIKLVLVNFFSFLLFSTCISFSQDQEVREVLENLSDLNFNYSLEVSSPGIDRKFFRINQLKDYLGEMVKVSCFLDGKKCKLKGELKDVSEKEISLISQGQIYKILNGDYLSSNLIGTNYE